MVLVLLQQCLFGYSLLSGGPSLHRLRFLHGLLCLCGLRLPFLHGLTIDCFFLLGTSPFIIVLFVEGFQDQVVLIE